MVKYNKLYAILLTAVIFISTSKEMKAGGPWPKAKGTYYMKLSEWVLVFDQHYTDNGKLDPNITTGIYNTFLYGEFGLTDRLTATFNGNLFGRNTMNNVLSATTNDVLIKGEAYNGLGDIDMGIKYGLTQPGAKIPIAASVILGLPTGATGKGEFGNLATGDGEFNQQIQVDAGSGFALGKNSGYLSCYTAINNRTNGFSEEFRFGAEFGVGVLNNKLWLNSKLNIIKSFKNGDTAETITSTSIFANNTEFTSLGVEANYYITDKIGISANYTGALSGRIIAAAPSYSFGVYIDIK